MSKKILSPEAGYIFKVKKAKNLIKNVKNVKKVKKVNKCNFKKIK